MTAFKKKKTNNDQTPISADKKEEKRMDHNHPPSFFPFLSFLFPSPFLNRRPIGVRVMITRESLFPTSFFIVITNSPPKRSQSVKFPRSLDSIHQFSLEYILADAAQKRGGSFVQTGRFKS
jgi:hypothetical protein